MKQKHKVKWLLFHSPVELFLRTANAFSDEIKQLTDGRIDIEVYTIEQYAKEVNSDVYDDPLVLLKDNKIQMSQVQTYWLGVCDAVDFFAFDLPFLFKDHDHASRVLEGDIGNKLLDDLVNKTGMRGLAFTYSGGYRVIASTKEIKTAADLQGLSMAVKTSPVLSDMAKAFGTEPTAIIDAGLLERKQVRSDFDTIQTTLPRYALQVNSDTHPYVTNTRHNMFLTTIVINEEFWNSLSIEDQLLMRKAAFNSARLERQWSVDDATKIETDKTEQEKLGIKSMIEMSEEEIVKLKESSKTVLDKYRNVFTKNLIDDILES
jgi:TRAP-type C4-dicarboxylate transport system substrate-binding protein